MKKVLFIAFALAFASQLYAQRKPMEPSLTIGYQRFMTGTTRFTDSLGEKQTGVRVDAFTGFLNLGYTGFYELESNYRFTHRARFNASALINPFKNMYGLQLGGTYSYVLAGGFKANMIRTLPLSDQLWMVNLTPQVGIDIWFMSFMMGYAFQINNAPPSPQLSRLSYELNIYWPLKRNKRM
ncbi:MAG: hypothetical protein ACPGLV_01240, partial [Bacteroidia bacterium]